MEKVANILSGLFHPLIIPVYALLHIYFMPFFYGEGYYFTQLLIVPMNTFKQLLIFGSMFLLVVPPLIWYLLLYKLNIVKSLRATTRKERVWPYIFTILSYSLVGFICGQLDVEYGFDCLWKGASLALIIVFIVNLFWKISAHATGVGSWLGMLVFLSIYNSYPLLSEIIVIIFIGGLVGWARLKLDAHTPLQVLFGYLVGFVSIGILPFFIFL